MIVNPITSPTTVADFIANKLNDNLSVGKKVLWLVSGGSAIALAVQVSKLLSNTSSLANLSITLTDERYGAVGHADSNWQQLELAGFDLPAANLLPVLTGKNPEETIKDFAKNVEGLIKQADFSLGLFGMGGDGHTAGMLPFSSSASEQTKLAVQYKGPDFERITLTCPFISKLDTAILYAVGPEKMPALIRLKDDIATTDQPAQVLKQVKEFYIFTDNKLDLDKGVAI